MQVLLTQAMGTGQTITSKETMQKINKQMVVQVAILSTKEAIMGPLLMDIRVNINQNLTILRIQADLLKEESSAKIKTQTPIIKAVMQVVTIINQKVSIMVEVVIKNQILGIKTMEVAEATRIKATIMVVEEAIKNQVGSRKIITTMAVSKNLGKRNLSVVEVEATKTITITDLLSISKVKAKNRKSQINMEVAQINTKEVDTKNLLIRQRKMEVIKVIRIPINRMVDTNSHFKVVMEAGRISKEMAVELHGKKVNTKNRMIMETKIVEAFNKEMSLKNHLIQMNKLLA